MIAKDIWFDKLPEDKAKYYNRTRMSIELFASKMGMSHQILLEEFNKNGYRYFPDTRRIEKVVKLPFARKTNA